MARGLLAAAEAGPLDELGRARVDLLQAEVAFAQDRGGDAPLLLLGAARKLETLDVRLSRDTYLDAWAAGLFAGRLAGAGGSLLDVSRAVATAPGPVGPPLACDLLLDGLALIFTEGRSAATPVLRRAIAAFAGAEVSAQEVLRWGWLATRAANFVWDYDSCLEIGMRAVQLARDAGALEILAAADNACGQAAAFGGDFAHAAQLIAEVEAVKEATGTRIPPHAAIALAGIRGNEAAASELIAGMVTDATAAGQGAAVQYARWAESVLMNGLGRYEEALAAAVEASENTPELYIAAWALSELIEAAARTGNAELAAARAHAARRAHPATDADWALGIHARSRALLSEAEAAEPLYRAAIDRLGRTRLRPDLARAKLLYGEWLRREHRRVDARAQLHAAYDLFVRDRDGGVRGACPGRAAGHGREGAQADRHDARRAHPAGAADRAARPRRAVEPGDRRAALPEPAHRGVAPAQGVRQARHPLAPGALPRVAELGLRAGPGLTAPGRNPLLG